MITNFVTSNISRFCLFSSIVLAVLSGGCATLEDAFNSAPRPTAKIIGADVRNLSLLSLDLVFDVEVSNPYGVNLPLVDLNYTIGTGQLQLLQGGIKPSGSVPAYGSSVMQIPARLDLPAVMKLLKTVRLGSVIPYSAEISVGVDAPVLGLITLPLNRQGEFPIPAVPEISIASFDISSLSWDEVRATARIQIKNVNQFQIDLAELGFDLKLDKSNVASTRLRSTSKVGAGQATIVDIPISFLPSAFGAGMFNLLRGSETGYGIAGKVDIDTRFGPLSLPFSNDGKTVIQK